VLQPKALVLAVPAHGLDRAAHAVAAVIDRAALQALERLRAARLGRRTVTPLLLLTGGAAAALSPRVSAAHRVEADLVLRGLAELAYNA
jgi:pantothenate kinase type III